jgi:hypothetical protein
VLVLIAASRSYADLCICSECIEGDCLSIIAQARKRKAADPERNNAPAGFLLACTAAS